MTRTLLLLGLCLSWSAPAADRVSEARRRRLADLEALLARAGLTAPVAEVYLRMFKDQAVVELWASGRPRAPMVLVKTYPVCAASGEPGPKRREGDLQVPEGLYEVSEFNPLSSYHLALKVSYPNASDRVRSDARRPGGLIYVHGKCASIGCIAIEDEAIEEVYLLALDARKRPIRIDIFPSRLEGDVSESPHASFWAELAPAVRAFELTRRPPPFRVDRRTGAYVVTAPTPGPGPGEDRR